MGVDLHTLACEPQGFSDLLARIDTLNPGRVILSPNEERHLKDLLRACREANFKEAGAYALKHPRLMGMPDRCGCTALHHAVMSGRPDFVMELLKLYRDPRTFSRRSVVFQDQAELLSDDFSTCITMGPWPVSSDYSLPSKGPTGTPSSPSSGSSFSMMSSPRERTVVVQGIGRFGTAYSAGIQPGDILESTDFNGRIPMAPGDTYERHPYPSVEPEELHWVRHKDSLTKLGAFAFPLRLRFSRPVHSDILASDSWKFLDLGAGKMGSNFKKIHKMLLAEKLAMSTAPVPLRLSPPLPRDPQADDRRRSAPAVEQVPMGFQADYTVAPPNKVFAGPPGRTRIAEAYQASARVSNSANTGTRLPAIAQLPRIPQSSPQLPKRFSAIGSTVVGAAPPPPRLPPLVR